MPYDNPFSFHCMICFEEFHPEERFPVVLPCGHTYVCNVCSNRLDKCPECRHPLYTVVRPKTAGPNNNTNNSISSNSNNPQGGGGGRGSSSAAASRPSWSNARSGGHSSSPPPGQQQQQQPPAVKKRLPLPKNVVLLSLIEATELATNDVNPKFSSSPGPAAFKTTETNATPKIMIPDSPEGVSAGGGGTALEARPSMLAPAPHHHYPQVYGMNSMVDADDDDDDEEDKKIKAGVTSLAVGVAGTYAVAARAGMEIFPNRPSSSSSSQQQHDFTATEQEDVDSLVTNSTEKKKRAGGGGGGGNDPSSPDRRNSGRAKLSFGDRVQVVSLEGSWAKLARGYGYVRADKSHLVKVGGAVDQACKLEAMLRNLSHQRKLLRHEQSRVDNQFIRLMNDLQLSLQKDEDLTVIVADAFKGVSSPPSPMPPYEDSDHDEKKSEHRYAATATGGGQQNTEENGATSVDVQKPTRLNPQMTPTATTTEAVQRRPQPSFVCFAGDVFSAYSADQSDIPQPRYSSTNNDNNGKEQPQVNNNNNTSSPTSNLSEAMLSLFPTSSHPSPSALRAGAQAWRERYGALTQTGGIDFRTGMSGHMALLSTHAHAHEFLEPTQSIPTSGSSLRMSSHTGLTMSKSRFRGILSSLTIPTFGTSSARERREDMVHPSESM